MELMAPICSTIVHRTPPHKAVTLVVIPAVALSVGMIRIAIEGPTLSSESIRTAMIDESETVGSVTSSSLTTRCQILYHKNGYTVSQTVQYSEQNEGKLSRS